MAVVEDPEEFERYALARLQPSFAGLRVLEIGAGDGRLTRRYVRDAASVVAIDPDEEDIAALRDELPHVDARAVGIESLALPGESVDIVLFAWSL
jgi:2-polyprenyl-3-methyl-5-hydroxy-6-metoxy-1,4-benzoquinol methylase